MKCFHTLAGSVYWWHEQRAILKIAPCGTMNKINGKHKLKWAETRKKGHGGKHTRPKKWPNARRTCRISDDGLGLGLLHVIFAHLYQSLYSFQNCVKLSVQYHEILTEIHQNKILSMHSYGQDLGGNYYL